MLIALALSTLVLAALELSDNEIGLHLDLSDTAIGILMTFSANPAAGFSATPL